MYLNNSGNCASFTPCLKFFLSLVRNVGLGFSSSAARIGAMLAPFAGVLVMYIFAYKNNFNTTAQTVQHCTTYCYKFFITHFVLIIMNDCLEISTYKIFSLFFCISGYVRAICARGHRDFYVCDGHYSLPLPTRNKGLRIAKDDRGTETVVQGPQWDKGMDTVPSGQMNQWWFNIVV